MKTLLFDQKSITNPDYYVFLNSNLGALFQALPFDEIAEYLADKINHTAKGRKSIFSLQGKLGLMFLKPYLRLSDAKLIERVNTDWQLQYFCGIQLSKFESIKDKDIVGRCRREISLHFDINDFQDILARHWKEHMTDTHILMDDATCFESAIKYPTDVGLLYDCACFLFELLAELCQSLSKPIPRTKFSEQHKKQRAYMMLRRKPKKRTKKRMRQLLDWVRKGLHFVQLILDTNPEVHSLIDTETYDKIKVIRQIRQQQGLKFNNPEYKIKNRIVSLYKPYIRPIVRGKVNKLVEFGAKVHISQVDQINFIEHLSFNAFHEGIRMKKSIRNHISRFGMCRAYAGDKIYANRANRKHTATKGIITSFVPVGRPSKDTTPTQVAKQSLAKGRATVLEGSFGNIKNNYMLGKIRARKKETEIAWIFFAIHTANAVNIAKRIKINVAEKVPLIA